VLIRRVGFEQESNPVVGTLDIQHDKDFLSFFFILLFGHWPPTTSSLLWDSSDRAFHLKFLLRWKQKLQAANKLISFFLE